MRKPANEGKEHWGLLEDTSVQRKAVNSTVLSVKSGKYSLLFANYYDLAAFERKSASFRTSERFVLERKRNALRK